MRVNVPGFNSASAFGASARMEVEGASNRFLANRVRLERFHTLIRAAGSFGIRAPTSGVTTAMVQSMTRYLS
jgi:hypothetical protein